MSVAVNLQRSQTFPDLQLVTPRPTGAGHAPRLSMHIDWLRSVALPFWLERAADDSGLFFEALHFDGTPDVGAELRLRTGMRQVYVFAEAARLGLADKPAAIALAERIAEALRAVAWGRDGKPGWAACFHRDGAITDPRRDLYDHAFALLGLAALLRATGSSTVKAWLDDTTAAIDSLISPLGGWEESDLRPAQRRQNPHMHLFEASLYCWEAFGPGQESIRSRQVFQLFRRHFFPAGARALIEYFGPGWEVSPQFHSHRHDPGHMAEWIWLLRRYARMAHENVDGECEALRRMVLRAAAGGAEFLPDEVDAEGAAILDRRRLWLQTEFLKALAVEAVLSRQARLRGLAEDFCVRMHATFLCDATPGTWRDRFDLAGRPTAENVPASTLYHLVSLAAELLCLQHDSAEIADLQPALA